MFLPACLAGERGADVCGLLDPHSSSLSPCSCRGWGGILHLCHSSIAMEMPAISPRQGSFCPALCLQ